METLHADRGERSEIIYKSAERSETKKDWKQFRRKEGFPDVTKVKRVLSKILPKSCIFQLRDCQQIIGKL